MKRSYWIVPFLLLALLLCGWAANSGEQRTELRIAAASEDAALRLLTEKFNESQSNYQAVIDVYAQEDADRLRRDIAAGSGPDVIDLSLLSPLEDSLALEDLNGYWDDAVRPEELMTTVLSSWERDGALPAVPTAFCLDTMAARRADVGDAAGWTAEDMERLWMRKGEGWLLLDGWMTQKEYVKWVASLSVGLDPESIQDNLHLAKLLPSRDADSDAWPDAPKGPSIARIADIQNPASLAALRQSFGEEITLIGFPTRQGGGHFFRSIGPLLAISAESRHKDAAWQLIALALGHAYQKEMTALCGGFSIRRDVWEAALTEALNQSDGFTEREASQLRDLTDRKLPVTKHDPAAADWYLTQLTGE